MNPNVIAMILVIGTLKTGPLIFLETAIYKY